MNVLSQHNKTLYNLIQTTCFWNNLYHERSKKPVVCIKLYTCIYVVIKESLKITNVFLIKSQITENTAGKTKQDKAKQSNIKQGKTKKKQIMKKKQTNKAKQNPSIFCDL
jgi:hypothetical protein